MKINEFPFPFVKVLERLDVTLLHNDSSTLESSVHCSLDILTVGFSFSFTQITCEELSEETFYS